METESESLKDLSLESIKGFRGDTEDSLTKVSASGETVMNIISTLSFLLESKRLYQIKINLGYGCHDNIELQLINNGAVVTEIKEYQGEFVLSSEVISLDIYRNCPYFNTSIYGRYRKWKLDNW